MIRSTIRQWAYTAATALSILIAGCGPSTTTATGNVTYKDKPIVWGSVSLIASDGSMHQAAILPDGTFTLPNVPKGLAKVGVTSPTPPAPIIPGSTSGRRGGDPRVPELEEPSGPPPGTWIELPLTASDPAKSGITIDVKTSQPVTIVIP